MTKHTVSEGDCVLRLAERYGFDSESLWSHADNSALRRDRQQPSLLQRGDEVAIPELSQRSAQASTGKRHRFRRNGVPVRLRLRMREHGEPLKNAQYRLILGNDVVEGETDDEGRIDEAVPPALAEAKLVLGDDQTEYLLRLGNLDPLESDKGVQSRLNNLGFSCGDVDGVIGPETERALQVFQETYGLDVTGTLNDETRNKLGEIHGC